MTNERTFSKDKKERGGISLRNLLNKKLKNEKGLTLIELLAVIVILAIIALIAIPAIGSIISNSKSKAILSDATAVVAGAKTAIADGACEEKPAGTYTCNEAALKNYVEGVKLVEATTGTGGTSGTTGDQVVKTGEKYTVTYAALEGLNEKYSKALFGTEKPKTTTTQENIATVMNGGKVEKTTTPTDSPTN